MFDVKRLAGFVALVGVVLLSLASGDARATSMTVPVGSTVVVNDSAGNPVATIDNSFGTVDAHVTFTTVITGGDHTLVVTGEELIVKLHGPGTSRKTDAEVNGDSNAVEHTTGGTGTTNAETNGEGSQHSGNTGSVTHTSGSSPTQMKSKRVR
ncbi:MAG: hypothetical protein K8E66_10385 [Phycisphaerales bacterium]|nr:hypothetical protein [Phycisphaerales bacterium]